MPQSPFEEFFLRISRVDEHRPRLAWLELRRIFGELVYGPIWRAEPATLSDWLESAVPRRVFQRLGELAPSCPALSPAVLGDPIPLREAFDALERVHAWASEPLLRSGPAKDLKSLANIRERPGRLPGGYARAEAVDHLIAALRTPPPSIAATLLHGSLGDGLVREGYSDADVLCVIRSPRAGGHGFWEAARWLFELNRRLLAVQPLMHHGPMFAFENDFSMAAEGILPSAVVRNGSWISGGFPFAAYRDGTIENAQAFECFEAFFERQFLFVADFRTAFDILWWVSNALILPVLARQAFSGSSIYKRDCLSGKIGDLEPEDWSTIGRISSIRDSLGQWLAGRGYIPEPDQSEKNPGLTLRQAQEFSRLSPAETRRLGLTDGLLADLRQFWLSLKQRVLGHACERLGIEPPIVQPRVSFDRPLFRAPRPLKTSDYAEAMASFLGRCAKAPSVVAVREFGQVGCPGLSDIDLCVILDDAFPGCPPELLLASFPEDVAYVFDHDPVFVSESMAPFLGAITPIKETRLRYGKEVDLGPTERFCPEVRLGAITALNLRKYPRDVDRLLSQPKLNARTLLAFLHSVHHIDWSLRMLGRGPSDALAEAIRLDREIRAAFAGAGHVADEDIFRAIVGVQKAAETMCFDLAAIWRDRLRPDALASSLFREDGHLLDWVRTHLAVARPRPEAFHRSQVLDDLLCEYRAIKRRVFQHEAERNRTLNSYIEDGEPDVSLENPAWQGDRIRLMEGWHPPDTEGNESWVWSGGQGVLLFLARRSAAEISGEILSRKVPNRIAVYRNGAPFASIVVDRSGWMPFRLPGLSAGRQPQSLTLVSSRPAERAAGDDRPLAFAVRHLTSEG